MTKKARPLPKIVERENNDGFLITYDCNGRLCFDLENPERIVLIRDLRTYGDGLHIGALGWTIPETSDGYKFSDVLFDTGQKLRLSRYAFNRIEVEYEKKIERELISQHRNTRFDADPHVAASCKQAWIKQYYSEYLTLSETVIDGTGDQELYAFTFPSLIELSTLKSNELYPIKIGFSKDQSDGAIHRIRSQILEKAGYPEKPTVLLMFRTWDARHLETQVHKQLRLLERKVLNSLGSEWFVTSTAELLKIIKECNLANLPADRVIHGCR